MSQFSNYLAGKLADHSLGVSTYTPPSTLYIGLFINNPGKDDSGIEVSGNGYARQSISFNASSDGVAKNSSTVVFTASGGSFGTVTHFALFDSVAGGNMLYFGMLGESRLINDGETVTFNPSTITVTLE